jgi:hypothetical protein
VVRCGSRRSALATPRARRAEGRVLLRETFFPLGGGPSFTPARLAFDSPMAIACCGDLTPCLPSRT